jgi:hypothetical protein
MRLEHFRIDHRDDLAQVLATVHWEDNETPPSDLFIATTAEFEADLAPDPNAFLVGCLVPAMYLGERRIRVDAAICPELKEGLDTAMALMQHWSPERFVPLAIEAPHRTAARYRPTVRRCGAFLSGGFDSLAALRLNRLNYHQDHPGYIHDCLVVHGFDIGGVVARGMKFHVFERALAHMAPVARDAGVTLIPVYTNIRHLCDERDLWLDKFFGAVLAAVGHALGPRISLLNIASSFDIPNLVPCGSHPMLDPLYGSAEVRIRHRDHGLSRLEKLRIVAGWPVAFNHFRVCLANVPDQLNCGRCEKCVRTMTELLAIGQLHRTAAFDADDVTPDMLAAFRIDIRHREVFYGDLIDPLRAMGRDDLADAIAAGIAGRRPAL